LRELISRVRLVNEETRRIMSDLRPSLLDDLGIVPAISWFCREYEKIYSHIRVEKEISLSERDLADSLKTAIYRVCQEAMNNIAKHSQASLVSLDLQERDGRIELTIQDNGQGFDLDTARRGLGLSTMRERSQLSGGSFNIQSAIGKGTIVRVSWPR
jgi:signal transduction histidine kinase